MSSLSQFLSSAALPIGSVVRLSSSVTADLVTQNGAEYLRLGKLVPYQTKYAQAASLGLNLNRWPARVGLGGNIPVDPGSASMTVANTITRKMFAKGVMGVLQGHSNEIYTFTGVSSTIGLTSPVVLKMPTRVASGSTVANRLIPHYLSGLDMWVSLDFSISGNGDAWFYTSRDGSNWKTTYLPTGILPGGTNSYIALATTRTNVFIAFATASSALQIYKANVLSTGEVQVPQIVTNYSSASLTQNGMGFTVGPDDAVFACGSGTTTSILAFDDSSVTDRIYTIGSVGYTNGAPIYFDRNPTSGQIAMVLPHSGGSNNIMYGTRVTNLTTGTGIGAVANVSNGTFVYTGAYWVYYAEVSGSYGFYYSTNDAVSWASYTTGVLGTIGTLRGAIFKNHMILAKVANKVFQFASGTESGTSPPPTGAFGYLIQTTSFNGNHVVLREQCVGLTGTGYTGGEDLKWWNSTNLSPITSYSRFKVVNGKLFVNGLTTGSVLTSNDGIAWTKTDIAGLTGSYDIAFVNSRYVVGGLGSTSNNFYSSDLSTWTAGTVIGTAGTNPIQNVFTIGTAAVALSSNTTPRRTTDGATWATIATLNSTPLTNTSYFVEGTTAYVFMHTSTSSGCLRYTSTDSGATWASVVTNIKGSGLNVYPVPHSIIKYNGLYYSIVGSKAYNDSGYQYGVHSSTDLINWTPVNFIAESRISPADPIPTLYVDANGLLMMNSSSSGSGGATDVTLVLEGSSTGYIGSQEIITPTSGEVGFVRIA